MRRVNPRTTRQLLLVGMEQMLIGEISQYDICKKKDGTLLLESFNRIPERERWIYENPEVLGSIMRGLKGLAAGEGIPAKEDFSKYLEEDE